MNKETLDKIRFFSEEMIEVNQRMTALVCRDKTKAAEANLSLIQKLNKTITRYIESESLPSITP
jgi:septation ring formation regulator EzrA